MLLYLAQIGDLRDFRRPIILVHRAEKLRKETGDTRWWAPFERRKVSLKERVESVIARPFKVFFR